MHPNDADHHWVELVNVVADLIAGFVEHVDALHNINTLNVGRAYRSLGGSDVFQRLQAAVEAAGMAFVIAARVILTGQDGIDGPARR